METWNATAWNRNTALKLTNMLIQPATSRCVLKNVPFKYAAGPSSERAAARRNARKCA